MTNIKAVGFDFGGVIGGDPNIGHEFTVASAKLLGVTVAEWRDAYFSMNHLINTRQKSKRDYWRAFLTRFGQIDKLEQLIDQDIEMAARYMVVNPRIISLIGKLRLSGYKVGLLSNASSEVATKIKKLDILKHFDAALFSIDIAAQKPDPQVFFLLAKSLGVDISELVFIDDAEKSLATANECGYTPILFKSPKQLDNELHKLGVTY